MLFVFATLSQALVSNVHASSGTDNWPKMMLGPWLANESIEWEYGGLPDPQFTIIEADSISVDCINTPHQYTLNNACRLIP